MAKDRRKRRRKDQPREPLVNSFTQAHGDYREATVVDLSNELGGGRQKTYRVLKNHAQTIVDQWLTEGGPGFDEPQRRAIQHCRSLWHRIGGHGALVANLMATGGGHAGRERGLEQAEAMAQLAQYESRIPRSYWLVFELLVRHGQSAGPAGAHFTTRRQDQAIWAKSCVGFVASLIAQWRGF